jgi:hypothetical protein
LTSTTAAGGVAKPALHTQNYINTTTMDTVPVRAGNTTIHAVDIQGVAGCVGRNQMFWLHNAGQTQDGDVCALLSSLQY